MRRFDLVITWRLNSISRSHVEYRHKILTLCSILLFTKLQFCNKSLQFKNIARFKSINLLSSCPIYLSILQVHDKHQPTNMKQYGIAVPVGTKGYAKMSRRDTQLMYKPWGRCDPKREKTLNYFSKYSMAACMTGWYDIVPTITWLFRRLVRSTYWLGSSVHWNIEFSELQFFVCFRKKSASCISRFSRLACSSRRKVESYFCVLQWQKSFFFYSFRSRNWNTLVVRAVLWKGEMSVI